jgi:hypothetical protein
VFSLGSLELTYRNRSLRKVHGIVEPKYSQPGAVSLGLDLSGSLKGSLLQDLHALLPGGIW